MALWKLIVYLLGCLLETVNGSVASTERYNYNWPLRIFNSRALTLTTVTPLNTLLNRQISGINGVGAKHVCESLIYFLFGAKVAHNRLSRLSTHSRNKILCY